MANSRTRRLFKASKWLIPVAIIALPFLAFAPATNTCWKEPKFDNDLHCLAANVYHEARGEPWLGQVLVARATLNRVASKLYPDTICGVVYQYRQFSWTLEPKQIGDYKAYQLALQAAKAAYNYNSPVTHFHKSNINPKWASNLTRDIQVNNHVFYY